MIRCLIIDDEINSCRFLKNLLLDYCSDVKVTGMAHNAQSGYEAVMKLKPDLVFLDIQMPGSDGFSFLNMFTEIDFKIIFTTAYDQYAVNAFRFAAIDYLLKPLSIEQLVGAVDRYKTLNDSGPILAQLDILREKQLNTIALPGAEEIRFVNIDQIIRLEAASNYTNFHMVTGKHIIVSNTLKTYEELLSDRFFMRIHNSHMVNLKKVTKYIKGKGGYAVLEDGSMVEVSPRKKEDFLRALNIYL